MGGRNYKRIHVTDRLEVDSLSFAIRQSDKISLDIETYNEQVLSVAVVLLELNPNVAYCVTSEEDAKVLSDAILYKEDLYVYGHYVSYDLSFLAKRHGSLIRCKAIDSAAEDFFRQERVERGERTLSFLAKRAGEEKFDEDRENLKDLPVKQLVKYNCQDALIVDPVVQNCRSLRVKMGEYSNLPSRLYSEIIPFISDIQSNGFAVNLELLAKEAEIAVEAKKTYEKLIYDTVGCEFNLNSPQQKSWALFGKNSGLRPEGAHPKEGVWEDYPTLNLTPPRVKNIRGKTGVVSTRKEVLESLPDTPMLKVIGDWVLTDKLLANLEKVPQYTVRGIVYPDYDMYRIVSGRIAVTNPPLQTYSAKKMPQLKKCFVSRWRDLGKIVKLDGSQMELRWAAMESNCLYLCEAFSDSDRDFHQETADLGETPRSVGKTINFASVYGCSKNKIIEILQGEGKSYEEAVKLATRIKNHLEHNWAELYAYEDTLRRDIVRKGKTCTNYSFYRHVRGVSSRFDPLVGSALNFRFQAPASHLTQLLGRKITQESNSYLIFPVMTEHDGLTFDVHSSAIDYFLSVVEGEVKSLPEYARDYMNTDLTIPFEFDITKGPDWYEQEKACEFRTI